VDGNERVAAAAAIVFLTLDGYRLTMADEALSSLVLGVARGELSQDDVTKRLRAGSTRIRR
jgi:prophage maintenance system killer protein